MDRFTMYISRDGAEVQIGVHLPRVNDENNYFYFSFGCRKEWVARLLENELRETFAKEIESVRKNEYEAGLKDARVKKENRRDFFSSSLSHRK